MSERFTLPVLPLRDFVLFPGVTAPINAGRPATLRAIEAALATPERLVFAVSQREDTSNNQNPTPESLHTIGTVARIGQLQRGLAGVQLLLQGEHRGIAMRITEKDGYLEAVGREAEEMRPLNPKIPPSWACFREARERAAELGERSGLPEEVVHQVLDGVTDPGRLADLVAGYIDLPAPQRQALLETLSVEERLRRVLVHVQRQLEVLEAQEDIKSRVQEELGERQREMFLREQLKAIQKELGEGDVTATRSRSCARSSPSSTCPRRSARRSTASSAGSSAWAARRWRRRSSAPTWSGSPSCPGTRAATSTSTSRARPGSSKRTTTAWRT